MPGSRSRQPPPRTRDGSSNTGNLPRPPQPCRSSFEDPLSVPVEGPMNVTALFYPGLMISRWPRRLRLLQLSIRIHEHSDMVKGSVAAGQLAGRLRPAHWLPALRSRPPRSSTRSGVGPERARPPKSVDLALVTGPSSIAANTATTIWTSLIIVGAADTAHRPWWPPLATSGRKKR